VLFYWIFEDIMSGKHIRRALGLAVMVLALAGCESAKKVFSNQKSAPDEFTVYSRPPLSLPPEYGLKTPEPGVSRPQLVAPIDEAKIALWRSKPSTNDRKVKGASAGINAILRDTGGSQADPSIRMVVNQETSVLSEEDQRLIDKMIFWVDNKPYTGTQVDAAEERRRIQENKALGRSVSTGASPYIKPERGRKGLLEF
jgi:hypothetical protein